MKIEQEVFDESRNVVMTAYLQDVGGKFDNILRRPAILILPGGYYQYCSDREADPVAFEYLKAGFQVFILRYSVAENCGWPAPLMDCDRAIGFIREQANHYHIYPDRIAVCGFSAGGHLAGASAVMGLQRPNAAILGYAVLNDDVKAVNPKAPDIVSLVDKKTCPCFIFANRDDDKVPIHNSVEMQAALAKSGVSFESHIYAYGGHGVSSADSAVLYPGTQVPAREKRWIYDSIDWLKELFGDFGVETLTEPVIKPRLNGDTDEYLSVDCTVCHILAVPAGAAILKPLLASMQTKEATESGQDLLAMVAELKLRDLLQFAGAPSSVIDRINDALNAVPNK